MPSLSQQFKFFLGGSPYGFIGSSGNGFVGSFGYGPSVSSIAVPTSAVSLTGNNTFYSDKLKGDGYYGSSDGVHTVTYTVSPDFKGTINVQATLSTEPTALDWFDVDNTTVNYNTTTNVILTTTTNYVNFTGNFVWVRTKFVRANAINPGYLQYVNYNH